jgi:argininosuccinate lyase
VSEHAVGADLAPGRLQSGPAPELMATANRLELSNAPYLLAGLSLADLAHVVMLLERQIIPFAAGSSLLSALLAAHDIPVEQFPLDPAWGDVYKNRERAIRQQVPDAGGWLRVGRARREATNIAHRLAQRQRLLRLAGSLGELAGAVVDRAEEHLSTIVPDYTYLQQAQPTTLGHYLLGFVYPMLRDADRLQACFARINRSPGGIGSVNGSRLPLDRQRVADLLGFDGAIVHTRDAMWQADMPVEVSAMVVALLVNLDRLAEDLQVWATQEFNLVELADGYSRTSVIMPQKKNPYSLTYIRGLANVSIGHLVAMANVGRTPTGQPDNRIFAYGGVPRALQDVSEAAELLAGVMRTLQIKVERMAHATELGYLQATDLAEVIMSACDLPYETAHRIVGQVVATAVEKGIRADAISVEMLDDAARATTGQPLGLPPGSLTEALDPRAIVGTRVGLGGASQASMEAMLADCRESLLALQSWRDEQERRLEAAERRLIELARRWVASPPLPVEVRNASCRR